MRETDLMDDGVRKNWGDPREGRRQARARSQSEKTPCASEQRHGAGFAVIDTRAETQKYLFAAGDCRARCLRWRVGEREVAGWGEGRGFGFGAQAG